jgi:HSP20 family protein
MDQLFDSALPLAAQAEAGVRGKVSAPLTLWEEPEYFYVELDLPGMKQEDIDITIDKNLLKITAERKASEAERKYWHQERAYGTVQRIVSLPETVATDNVEAEFKDGVLSVRLAKKPEVQPKKIAIRGSEAANS